MGLKTTNYGIKKFGITIPEAYARLTNISIDLQGEAFGTFEIHQNREDITKAQALDRVHINTIINKEEPIYSQLYIKAKETIFIDWEDDIQVEEEIQAEDDVQVEEEIESEVE